MVILAVSAEGGRGKKELEFKRRGERFFLLILSFKAIRRYSSIPDFCAIFCLFFIFINIIQGEEILGGNEEKIIHFLIQHKKVGVPLKGKFPKNVLDFFSCLLS